MGKLRRKQEAVLDLNLNKTSGEVIEVPLSEIKLNPQNVNRHPPKQIERLAKLIQSHGFREPGIISSRSGVLIAGEGRYLASKLLGLSSMPVMFQEFKNEDEETAFGVSTNAIASWAELDMSFLNSELIPTFGPDFDLDLLGIEKFELDPPMMKEPEEKKCPNCGFILNDVSNRE